jgi:hypothetical protein
MPAGARSGPPRNAQRRFSTISLGGPEFSQQEIDRQRGRQPARGKVGVAPYRLSGQTEKVMRNHADDNGENQAVPI